MTAIDLSKFRIKIKPTILLQTCEPISELPSNKEYRKHFYPELPSNISTRENMMKKNKPLLTIPFVKSDY